MGQPLREHRDVTLRSTNLKREKEVRGRECGWSFISQVFFLPTSHRIIPAAVPGAQCRPHAPSSVRMRIRHLATRNSADWMIQGKSPASVRAIFLHASAKSGMTIHRFAHRWIGRHCSCAMCPSTEKPVEFWRRLSASHRLVISCLVFCLCLLRGCAERKTQPRSEAPGSADKEKRAERKGPGPCPQQEQSEWPAWTNSRQPIQRQHWLVSWVVITVQPVRDIVLMTVWRMVDRPRILPHAEIK